MWENILQCFQILKGTLKNYFHLLVFSSPESNQTVYCNLLKQQQTTNRNNKQTKNSRVLISVSCSIN